MTNAQTNATFLASIDPRTKVALLSNIAKNYGITNDEAQTEVIAEGAELLLDYITGPERIATSLLMKRLAQQKPTRS